tara:strand:- start:272 stop:814 length:543 start_codon:yes stop_codon:yes gene_type:complete
MATTGTNVLNDLRIGSTFSTALSTTYADTLFSVKCTATGAGDVLTWDLDLNKFTGGSGDTVNVIDRTGHTFGGYQAHGGSSHAPTDIFGDTLPTLNSVAAILYVTDSDNNGTVTIASSGGLGEVFGSVILKGGDGSTNHDTGDFNRSALFFPRADPANVDITITFETANDDVTITLLGHS